MKARFEIEWDDDEFKKICKAPLHSYIAGCIPSSSKVTRIDNVTDNLNDNYKIICKCPECKAEIRFKDYDSMNSVECGCGYKFVEVKPR